MSKSRTEMWAGMAVAAIGLLLMAIMGLWVYMSATATPLHPNAQEAPSVPQAATLPRWATAVERGQKNRPRGPERAEPAGAVGGGRRRRRHRVG